MAEMADIKSELEDQDPAEELHLQDEISAENGKPKKHACPTCSKKFTFPWEVRRHIVNHDKQVRELDTFIKHLRHKNTFFAERKIGERSQL